jgi:hypothetical protein
LRSLKELRPVPGNIEHIKRQIGAGAMSLFVLDTILWILGIRGHIPGHDDFQGGPNKSSFFGNPSLMWILVVFAFVVALLSLVAWGAVWLAIKLL